MLCMHGQKAMSMTSAYLFCAPSPPLPVSNPPAPFFARPPAPYRLLSVHTLGPLCSVFPFPLSSHAGGVILASNFSIF